MIIIIDIGLKYYIIRRELYLRSVMQRSSGVLLSAVVNMHQASRTMKSFIKDNVLFLWIRRVVAFYLDGFRAMTLGKTLWMVIVIKLFVMFAVLKIFFFSDYLQSNFSTDKQRAEHVLERITLQTEIPTENKNE